MDLRRLIDIIRARFPLLVVAVLLAAGVGYAISSLLPKAYEAKATLIVGQSLSGVNPDYNQLLVSQRLSTTFATIATKRQILDAVIKKLDLGVTSDELSKRVRATSALDSTLLTIAAQDADPARAAAIANGVAQELLAASPAIEGRHEDLQAFIDSGLKATQAQTEATQAQVDALNALSERTAKQDADLKALEDRLASLRATFAALLTFSSANASNLLTILDPAAVPIEPISPKPLLNTALAAILGLLLVAGVLALREYLDDGIRDPDAVLEVAGLSTLGTIARMRGDNKRSEIYRLATILYPRSGAAEAYRTLRTNIEFSSVDAPIRTLLVTSAVQGEGKTVTAANLAVAFAQAGRRVLLVDADLRKPGVHLLFNLPNGHGLTTLLRSDEVNVDAIAQPTEQENLRVLTTGPLPPNPAELSGSQRMRTILDRLKASQDLVVFDSPPLQVTDPAILSSFLDATLVVIDARRSRRRSVRSATDALVRAGANMLGAVLNRIPGRALSDADQYGGYYGSEEERFPEAEQSPGRSAT